MGKDHAKLLRALIAAQAAVLAHADENVRDATSLAKADLMKALKTALSVAKNLEG